MRLANAITALAMGMAIAWSGSASALPVKLDLVWGGNGGGTTVFIHGHGNCVGGNGSDSRCVNLPYGYWLNSTEDGGDGHDFLAEATSKCTASGCTMSCASTGCDTIN